MTKDNYNTAHAWNLANEMSLINYTLYSAQAGP